MHSGQESTDLATSVLSKPFFSISISLWSYLIPHPKISNSTCEMKRTSGHNKCVNNNNNNKSWCIPQRNSLSASQFVYQELQYYALVGVSVSWPQSYNVFIFTCWFCLRDSEEQQTGKQIKHCCKSLHFTACLIFCKCKITETW